MTTSVRIGEGLTLLQQVHIVRVRGQWVPRSLPPRGPGPRAGSRRHRGTAPAGSDTRASSGGHRRTTGRSTPASRRTAARTASRLYVPLVVVCTMLQSDSQPMNVFCAAFMWAQPKPIGSNGSPYSMCEQSWDSGTGWPFSFSQLLPVRVAHAVVVAELLVANDAAERAVVPARRSRLVGTAGRGEPGEAAPARRRELEHELLVVILVVAVVGQRVHGVELDQSGVAAARGSRSRRGRTRRPDIVSIPYEFSA